MARESFVVTLDVPGVGRADLLRRLTNELQLWVHGSRTEPRDPEFLEAEVIVSDKPLCGEKK